MRLLTFVIILLLANIIAQPIAAQDNINYYKLKKGEVLDLIFLNTKPNTENLVKEYFSTAFPLAQKMTYEPLKGFYINEDPIAGNYHPTTIAVGKWSSYQKRQQFSNDVTQVIPNFHDQRKAIWSTFFMSYFEIKEDIEFQINKDKFNVLTAYWYGDDSKEIKKFKSKWIKTSEKLDGNNLILLENSASPFGYYYKPDLLIITEWKSQEEFSCFKKESDKWNHKSIRSVNQFILN